MRFSLVRNGIPVRLILTENNSITGIFPTESFSSEYTIQSYPGCMIVPGFVDLQIYGGNGRLFSHSLDIESLETTYAYCVSGGCSHFIITMATNSIENFMKGIATVKEYIDTGKKGLIGIHLEGPWISREKKGRILRPSFISQRAMRLCY